MKDWDSFHQKGKINLQCFDIFVPLYYHRVTLLNSLTKKYNTRKLKKKSNLFAQILLSEDTLVRQREAAFSLFFFLSLNINQKENKMPRYAKNQTKEQILG